MKLKVSVGNLDTVSGDFIKFFAEFQSVPLDLIGGFLSVILGEEIVHNFPRHQRYGDDGGKVVGTDVGLEHYLRQQGVKISLNLPRAESGVFLLVAGLSQKAHLLFLQISVKTDNYIHHQLSPRAQSYPAKRDPLMVNLCSQVQNFFN